MTLRVAWAAWATVTPVSDFAGYDAIAWTLLNKGVLEHSLGCAFRTPGYPIYLAIIYAVFGHSWRAAAIVQALTSGVTSGLIVLLAMRTLSTRAAVIAGLLHAFSVTSLVYVPVLASENPAALLLVASLLSLVMGHESVGVRRFLLGALAGVLYCSLLLTRPACGTLAGPAFAFLALYHPYRRRWSVGVPAAFFLAAGVTFLPWSLRNFSHGLSPLTISTQGGIGLWWDVYFHLHPGTAFAFPPETKGLSEQERDRVCGRMARAWIRENPQVYLAMCRARLARAFGASPDFFAAAWLFPTWRNDGTILAVQQYKPMEGKEAPAIVREYWAAIQWRQDRILRPYGMVLAALMLAGILLSLPRWRAFAFALLPGLSYLLLLSATVFVERYREVNNALLFIPTGALLADMFFGTRDLGAWLPRAGKVVFASAMVGASIYAHTTGMATAWYLPPASRIPNPDASGMVFKPVTFSKQPESYLIPWTRSGGATAAREGEGIRCQITVADKPRYAGILFAARAPQAIRLDMTILNPDAVSLLLVDAQDKDGGLVHRWSWDNTARTKMDDRRQSYIFRPGRKVGYFAASGTSDPEAIEKIQVAVKVSGKAGSPAGFILHRAEAARPERSETRPAPFTFTPLDLSGSPSAHETHWSQGLDAATIERVERGLRFRGRAPATRNRSSYGGMRFAVPECEAFRVRMSFEKPENIEVVFADGYAPTRERRIRWKWICRTESDRPGSDAATFELIPGQDLETFTSEAVGPVTDVRDFHVFIQIVPGREAGFVVESLEAGKRTATSAMPAHRATGSRPSRTEHDGSAGSIRSAGPDIQRTGKLAGQW